MIVVVVVLRSRMETSLSGVWVASLKDCRNGGSVSVRY